MGNQRIDFHHIKEYATQENNAVGPTTSLTLRTLDNTTPTNLNAVFLAMPGTTGASDAGANGSASTGILTAPVQTLEKAIDVIQAQPARNTIHIIRNGYVGTLSFSATANHGVGVDPFPAGSIVQVALGETALITFATGNMDWGATGGILKLNGIFFTKGTTGQAAIFIDNASGAIKWCSFIKINNSATDTLLTIAYQAGGTFNNNIVKGSYVNTSSGTEISGGVPLNLASGTYTMLNNIFYRHQPTHAIFSMGTFGNVTLTLKHCTFSDNLYLFDATVSSNNSVTVIDSILNKCIQVFKTNTYISVTIQNSLYDTLLRSKPITETNNLANILPLLISESTYDFHLQDRRRRPTGSTEYFPFSSRAVYDISLGQIPGDDTKDLGAYDVSYTLTQDDWESLEWDNEFWNDKLQVDFQLINYASFEDLRGNFHRAFDAVRRKINFGMVSNNWTGTEESYKLNRVITASGAKRFYPNGDDGLFDDSGRVMTINVDGTGLITANTTPLLQPDSLNGFICSVVNNDHTYFLRIKSHYNDNTNNYLILEDHRRNQLPLASGTFDIKCLYLPVEVDQESTVMIFENWDPEENPFMIPNVACNQAKHWEGNIRQFIIRECEEDE